MKTLIKRPNYTLSIKTSCYSAFSFYPFFGTGLRRTVRTNFFCFQSQTEVKAFYFALVAAALIALPSAFTSALYIGEGRTKASDKKPSH